MINLINWETRDRSRSISMRLLVDKHFTGINFVADNSSINLQELTQSVFQHLSMDNTTILFAHTSNLSNRSKFLNIIKALQDLYPAMLIVLYTGGIIRFIKKDEILLIDHDSLTFDPVYPDNIGVRGLEGYNSADFSESIHLKKALELFSSNQDKQQFLITISKISDPAAADFYGDLLQGADLMKALNKITDKKLLVFWDPVTIPENTICTHSLVTDADELALFDRDKLFAHDAVVCLAELGWGKKRSEYEGLAIAMRLRKQYKFTKPILVLSGSSVDDYKRMYQHNKDARFNIVFAPSTRLINMASCKTLDNLTLTIAEAVQNISSLSPAALQDINTMLLDEAGDLVDRFTHALFFNKDEHELNWLFDYATTVFSDNIQELRHFQQSLRAARKVGDEKEFETLKRNFLQLLESKFGFTQTNAQAADNLTGVSKFKVVIIEDAVEYQQLLQERLSGRFDVKIFSYGADAMKYLREQDEDMLTGCVISDWRLYKDNSQCEWQEMQGYDALREIALFHTASLVSLTSEIDKNVHAIRNLLGINITVFKKQYLQASAGYDQIWNAFADTIEYLCFDALSLVSSIPTGTNWKNKNNKNKNLSLMSKYLQRRRSDWLAFEGGVAARANQCWDYYKDALSDVNPFLGSIDVEFGLTLGDSLENMLVVRRLWLALWFSRDNIDFIGRIMAEETPDINIYIILKSIDLEDEKRKDRPVASRRHAQDDEVEYIPEWKRKLQNNAGAFAAALCIAKSELPYRGILPEEKGWLLQHNIRIDKNANNYYD